MKNEDVNDIQTAEWALKNLEKGSDKVISSKEMWNINITSDLSKVHQLIKEVYYSNIEISNQLMEVHKILKNIEKKQ